MQMADNVFLPEATGMAGFTAAVNGGWSRSSSRASSRPRTVGGDFANLFFFIERQPVTFRTDSSANNTTSYELPGRHLEVHTILYKAPLKPPEISGLLQVIIDADANGAAAPFALYLGNASLAGAKSRTRRPAIIIFSLQAGTMNRRMDLAVGRRSLSR